MKIKDTKDFTQEEKNWMDTITVNYIIAQSDGYQLGYAQAIQDFTQNIIDYWEGSDDKPQQSVLNALVDAGIELDKKQETARKNEKIAKERGYKPHYWCSKTESGDLGRGMFLYKKDFEMGEKEDKDE